MKLSKERIILDNRSSKPLYESFEYAMDLYFQEWDEAYKEQVMTYKGFTFYMKTNKDSITIQIYDN